MPNNQYEDMCVNQEKGGKYGSVWAERNRF